jgi:hypothetical protein
MRPVSELGIGAIIGALAVLLLMQVCKPEPIEPEIRLKTDTVWITKHEILRVVDIPDPYVWHDTVYIAYVDSVFIGEIFTFKDTATVGSVRVPFKISSTGLLTDLQLGAIYDFPTITKTKTIIQPPRGLYAGPAFHSFSGIGAQATYLRNRSQISIGYYADRSYNVQVGFKLF